LSLPSEGIVGTDDGVEEERKRKKIGGRAIEDERLLYTSHRFFLAKVGREKTVPASGAKSRGPKLQQQMGLL
jgi:hypothetical protein